EHVDDGAVTDVLVVPVIHSRTDDDHRTAPGFFGVVRKSACPLDHLRGRCAGDHFLPGRGVGHIVFVALCTFAAQAAIDAVVGAHQVENGGDGNFPVCRGQATNGYVARQHVLFA